eukprot:2952398-Pleurochrysis_carterae.AAC.1
MEYAVHRFCFDGLNTVSAARLDLRRDGIHMWSIRALGWGVPSRWLWVGGAVRRGRLCALRGSRTWGAERERSASTHTARGSARLINTLRITRHLIVHINLRYGKPRFRSERGLYNA